MERSKDLSADMVALRVAGTLLVTLLIAVPTVMAGSADGELARTSDVRIIGSVDLTTATLMWAIGEGAETSGAASALHIERLVDQRTAVPVIGGVEGNGGVRETAEHGESTFVLAQSDANARLTLIPEAPSQLAGSGGHLRAVTSALVFGDPATDARSCDGALACAEALGGYELELDEAAGEFEGAILILAHGYTLTVLDSGTTTTYRSGAHATDTPGGFETEDATLILRIDGGSATAHSPSISRVYAQAMQLRTAGRLIAEDADGDIRMGARSYHSAGERLEIDGAPELSLRLRAPPGPLEPRYSVDEPVVRADFLRVEIHGDIVAINLAATPVYREESVQVTGIGLILATLIGFAAYFWPILQFHATSLALPLYTRLAQPSLLDNDVRSGIYDIVRSNPGISARAAHRKSDQSWGTVVYHLRQLETHNLVVSRRHGRARNYYENHGKYRGMEKQLACLRSDRARLLAAQVLATPGLTQEALADAASLAQPTTSYYVRKLVHATLVLEEREGRYVHYVPGEDLARYLQASAPPTPTSDPTPVAQA